MKSSDYSHLSHEHDFWTWTAQQNPDVISVEKAKGVYFWDCNGNRYLDFNSMVMCVNIGHGNAYVQEAIIRQIKDLPFAGPHMSTKPRSLLGEKLASILPSGLDHYLYTLGGADANENAVKLARDFTGKFKILTRYRSYHGATMGAMALTGDYRRLHWEPNTMPGVVHFIDPFRYRSSFFSDPAGISEEKFGKAYLEHLEEIIDYEGSDTIAAILLETVTGTNGIIIPPKGYLEGVRAICERKGILMITDEVMCGFGRTGKMFAFEHWNIIPDIVTMAKGLTSGYAPLGAVAMKREIADFYQTRKFIGGLTYNSHPVSMAAALANIEVIESEKLVDNSWQRGRTLLKLLTELQTKHLCVGDIRSIGLFGAIELVKDRSTKEPLTKSGKPLSVLMKKAKDYISNNWVFMYNTNHILLIIPPLIITDEQLTDGFKVIDEALSLVDGLLLENHS